MFFKNHMPINVSQNEEILKLMKELSKGKQSGEEYGWISSEEARVYFDGQNLEG